MLHELDVKGPVVAFEVMLDEIPLPRSRSVDAGRSRASDLMPVNRDFAFIVAEEVEADRVVKAARDADKALITDVSVFDLFARREVGRRQEVDRHRSHAQPARDGH